MKQKTRRLLQNIGVLLLIAAGLGWTAHRFFGFTSSTYTDNARTQCQIVPVISRVQGFVKEVRFDDYTYVHQGDTLVIIEDAEFRLRLAQAEADVLNMSSGKSVVNSTISTIQNNLTVSDASLAEVGALLNNAKRDYDRYKSLLAQEAVTQQQFDAIATNYEALKAKHEALSRQKKSTALTGQEQQHRLGQSEAAMQVAQAALDLAKLNLSYTIITAPCDGYTSKKELQPGQLIQPGQLMVNIVDENDMWVIANYKETQTARMNIGDEVAISVDAIPGVKFKGTIVAISKATGTEFSAVKSDNATGNFVKVEQRVPVKIRFNTDDNSNDPEQLARLRAGLNVECKVKR
jgi:membrane fusion protein (multidrug efflux system)